MRERERERERERGGGKNQEMERNGWETESRVKFLRYQTGGNPIPLGSDPSWARRVDSNALSPRLVLAKIAISRERKLRLFME